MARACVVTIRPVSSGPSNIAAATAGAAERGPAYWRREGLPLVAVVLVALLVRLLHLWGQARHNPFFWAPTMDEQMHDEWARAIAAGRGLGAVPYFRAPLYYYLLAGMYTVFGPSVVAGRALGTVLGALTCGLIARLGSVLSGSPAALIAGLLAALYWPFIHFDTLLLTVGVEVFLNVALLLVLLAAVRTWRLTLFALAGVLWGLSATARPNVLALGPVLALWIWFVRAWRLAPLNPSRPVAARTSAARPISQRIAAIGLVLVGAAVAILPVTIRNRVVGGEWVLIATNGGVNFYIGNNPQADGIGAVVPGTRADWRGGYEDTHRIPQLELGRALSEREVSDYWYKRGWAWILEHPGDWLALTWRKLRLFWSPVEIPNNQPDWFFARLSETSFLYLLCFPVVAALAFAALPLIGHGPSRADAPAAGGWRAWTLPLAYGLVTMATVVVFFCPGRYRLPVVPVLMVLAADGLARWPALWRGRERGAMWRYALFGAAGLLFVLSNPPPIGFHLQQTEGMGHQNLAVHYSERGLSAPQDRDRAIAEWRAAIGLRPNDPAQRIGLAIWLLRFGRPEEAGPELTAALELAPDHPEARSYYGEYLVAVGRPADALPHFEAAVARQPTWLRPRLQLAETQARLAQWDAAARTYAAALQVDPGSATAAQGLAAALVKSGQLAQAASVLTEAVARFPQSEPLLKALAWLRATAPDAGLRNGPQAVELAERALHVAGRPSTSLLNTLAAALAENGQFERAVQVTEQAIAASRAAGQERSALELEARLELYRAGRPYRMEAGTAAAPAGPAGAENSR